MLTLAFWFWLFYVLGIVGWLWLGWPQRTTRPLWFGEPLISAILFFIIGLRVFGPPINGH